MSKVIRLSDEMLAAIEEYRQTLIYQNSSAESPVNEHINNILEELTEQQILQYALIYALNN